MDNKQYILDEGERADAYLVAIRLGTASEYAERLSEFAKDMARGHSYTLESVYQWEAILTYLKDETDSLCRRYARYLTPQDAGQTGEGQP